jgi:flagellar basal-body rod modification protein FlgD
MTISTGSGVSGTTADGALTTPGLQGTERDSLANKEVFLQLLVAQIKNQDPLSPTDGIEFITQLAQFTQLEQTLSMRSDLAAIRAAVEANEKQVSSAEVTKGD